jgi:hypothetical protein
MTKKSFPKFLETFQELKIFAILAQGHVWRRILGGKAVWWGRVERRIWLLDGSAGLRGGSSKGRVDRGLVGAEDGTGRGLG